MNKLIHLSYIFLTIKGYLYVIRMFRYQLPTIIILTNHIEFIFYHNNKKYINIEKLYVKYFSDHLNVIIILN